MSKALLFWKAIAMSLIAASLYGIALAQERKEEKKETLPVTQQNTARVQNEDSLAVVQSDSIRPVARLDSLLAKTDTLPPIPTLPDTVWAVRLTKVSTLDSALSLHNLLTEKAWDSFARIRANRYTYWYEVFAGPLAESTGVDSLIFLLQADGIIVSQDVIRAYREDLLRGVVTEPWRSSLSEPTSNRPREPASAATDKPQLVRFVEPEYHEVVRDARIEGSVVVNVLVGKNGEVLQTEVLESVHLLLDDAAVQAARKCQFVPALKNGQPVEAWLAVPFEFKID